MAGYRRPVRDADRVLPPKPGMPPSMRSAAPTERQLRLESMISARRMSEDALNSTVDVMSRRVTRGLLRVVGQANLVARRRAASGDHHSSAG